MIHLVRFTAQKMKFSIKDFFSADLVTFTEEILNRKFFCAVIYLKFEKGTGYCYASPLWLYHLLIRMSC